MILFNITQLNGFKFREWLHFSIWLVDETLTDTTNLGQRKPRNNSIKGYSTFSNVPELEPYHQMQFSAISRTLIARGVLPFSRYAIGLAEREKGKNGKKKKRQKKQAEIKEKERKKMQIIEKIPYIDQHHSPHTRDEKRIVENWYWKKKMKS